MLVGPNQRWMWQSIIPGITVSADASITVAPFGTSFATAVIASPSMITPAPRTGSFPWPSMRVPARTAMVVVTRGTLSRCAASCCRYRARIARIVVATAAVVLLATAVLAAIGWPARSYRDSDWLQYYAGSRAI